MVLDDITIVDLTRVRAGPWCTQILSELGAEVIKVERPNVGDTARGSFPERDGMGVNFISRNRNKKSVEINLKSEEGTELLEDLIADADVLVENFSLGVMEEFGLGYEYLDSEVNSDLVYASIKGYGEKGPYKDQKGVDLVMQAEAGIMSVTGPEGGDPVKVGQAIGDIGAGLYSTIAILAALHERDTGGTGQKVETNLFGTILSFMEEYITMYGMTGEDPEPMGTRHQTSVPYELFETQDGHVVINTLGVGWETFATELLDAPELAEYDTTEARQNNYDEIMDVMNPKVKEKTTEEWLALSDEYGFPCGPLNQVSDVVDHPQARARDYVFEYDDDRLGEVLLHGHPLHFSNGERDIRSGPPDLGEHTAEVLGQRLNLSEEELAQLEEEGVI
ncbi:Crotonobetainyl-CoA:carnitine CoA-transferase CaiB [Natronorubrum sediminis]|uniref:Crotonobetainyl-CoA:carnitine CoA-transferase CaiB n=2 Tax=Natronorubrum sediminis TaxID=640943 RepID=A0A1H6FRN3_9EURY|nr:CoA transferase [Natronorubrum sediminis]SEH13561.1 Crotonobetainyl-CoA:carnitine CoA-transferase CaiB [Natronorubrum sediminis]